MSTDPLSTDPQPPDELPAVLIQPAGAEVASGDEIAAGGDELVAAPLVEHVVPGPGFWGAIGCMVLFLGLQLVVGFIAYIGAGLRDAGLAAGPLLIVNAVSVLVATLVIVLVGCGKSARRVLAMRDMTVPQFVVVVLLTFPVLLIDASATQRVPGEIRESSGDAESSAAPARSPAARGLAQQSFIEKLSDVYSQMPYQSWPIVLICVCLVPAVAEELFFRGVLGRGLVARYGAFGILITSALFGLVHFEPQRVVATTLLGIVLQIVYLQTRSLLAPIVMHAVNNLAATLPTKLMQQFETDYTGLSQLDPGIPSELRGASLLAALALLVLLYTIRTQWIRPDGTLWSPGYTTAEMPPAALEAVPRTGTAHPAALLFAVVAFAVFAATYSSVALGPAWRGATGL